MAALDGIRVIDLSHALAGPYCTHQLALLGADVIKIEPPAGDDFRPRTFGRFAAVNAGKRSVVLDLKTDHGRQALARLVETADVVVENFRPGAAEKLGLDWARLHGDQPGLISCSISGFGQSGPMRDMPAIEWSVQAVSGVADSYLGEGTDALDLGIGILDPFTGHVAFAGILAALFERSRTGQGKRIDVAMQDAALALQAANTTAALLGGPPSLGRRATMARYQARDRRIFIASLNPKWLPRLCRIIGAPDLLDDPRFATEAERDRNAPAFVAAVEARLASRDAAEWEALLNAEGIPAGATRTLADAAACDQVRHRGLIHQVDSPAGPVPVVGQAFVFEGEPRPRPGAVPALGEHTSAVLGDIGLTSD